MKEFYKFRVIFIPKGEDDWRQICINEGFVTILQNDKRQIVVVS